MGVTHKKGAWKPISKCSLLLKSEKIALDWLKNEKKYRNTMILHHNSKSPDFICNDNNEFEVKKLYGNNQLFFSHSQKLQFLENDDLNIIIVDLEKEKVVDCFLYKDLEKTNYVIINGKPKKAKIDIYKNTKRKSVNNNWFFKLQNHFDGEEE